MFNAYQRKQPFFELHYLQYSILYTQSYSVTPCGSGDTLRDVCPFGVMWCDTSISNGCPSSERVLITGGNHANSEGSKPTPPHQHPPRAPTPRLPPELC